MPWRNNASYEAIYDGRSPVVSNHCPDPTISYIGPMRQVADRVMQRVERAAWHFCFSPPVSEGPLTYILKKRASRYGAR